MRYRDDMAMEKVNRDGSLSFQTGGGAIVLSFFLCVFLKLH